MRTERKFLPDRNSTFSPICLFAYKRVEHLTKALQALRACDLADQSRLIVFSDGPKGVADASGVSEVRNLIRGIRGFGTVEVVERQENLGLARSIIDGVTSASRRFGKVIVVEDDIVVSPYFLRFMNDALARYESDERVSSVSGYMYPVLGQLADQFFLRLSECWGWATWERAWRAFEPDGARLLTQIKAKGLEREFNIDGAMDMVGILTKQISGGVDSWAVRWSATNFLSRKLTLYPRVSMTRNIGNDGSGEHGGFTKIFDVRLAQAPLEVRAISIEEDEVAHRAVVEFLTRRRPTLFGRLRARVGRWVFRPL